MRRAGLAIVLAVAVGAIVLAAVLVPRSPRFLAWRYRGREVEIMDRAYDHLERAEALALHRLALEAMADRDPVRRSFGTTLVSFRPVKAFYGPAEIDAARRALLSLLSDEALRVCDWALAAVCRIEPDLFAYDGYWTEPERDARRAQARAHLQAELARE
jgi:hypothetical protein